jgi:phage shock protein C
MNKIVQVNLGGYPFTLDENAYQRLHGYLESLRRHFSASGSCDEIVADIEQRLAELLFREGEMRIVTLAMVETALGVMGQPAEIADGASDAEAPSSPPPPNTASASSGSPKRLFRDPDDSVVSGVCSGLSAYFGIGDPIWFRVGFVVAAFISLGFALLIYLVLMYAVPAAKTGAQKLAMRGEPINVDNIARTFEQDAQRFGETIRTEAEKIRTSSGLRQGAVQVGNAFFSLFKGAAKAIAFFAAGVTLLFFGVLWLVFATSFTVRFGELNEYFFPTAGLTWIAFASILLAVGVPMVGVLLFLFRLLFRYRPGPWYRSVSGGLFVLSLVGLTATALITLCQFKDGSETRSETVLQLPSGKPSLFRLNWRDNADSIGYAVVVQTSDALFGENALYVSDVQISVRASADSTARLTVYRRSMGNNPTEARRLAEAIGYEWRQEGGAIEFDRAFRILRGDKWRGQEAEVWLELPVGCILQYDRHKGERKTPEMRTLTIESKTHERL